MIGKPIVTYSKYAESSEGYIIAIDYSNTSIYSIDKVLVHFVNVYEAVSMELPNLLLELTGKTKQVAYSWSNKVLFIFLEDDFPYTTDVSVGIIGKRYNEAINSLDDDIDVRDDLVERFTLEVIKADYDLKGKTAPLPILQRLKELKT